jgi:(p)ppGpp synthase/HD superfamily hydrolase
MVDEDLPEKYRLTSRYGKALKWAAELHVDQGRKGTTIPYVSHVLAVSGLVLEHGGDEDQAIAGLLHDAIEDCDVSKDEIEARFGSVVARIVVACSDTDVSPKPPWLERKEAYLAHLPSVDADVLLVSLADKLHNVRTLAEDLDRDGEPTLTRFRGGSEGTRWYYRRLLEVYQARKAELPPDEIVGNDLARPGAGSLLREMRIATRRIGATRRVAAAFEAGRRAAAG